MNKSVVCQKRYDSVDHWIYTETQGIVQSGPFIGMAMLYETAWNDGNLSTKCLGCYEEELHPAIEYEVERLSKLEKPKIVDIGCAEGYYTIGLARRLPNATVYGVDVSEKSLAIMHRAAAFNGVEVKTGLPLTEVMDNPNLLIVDVEGMEGNYLHLKHFPNIVKSDIIVECHNFDEVSFTDMLTERFMSTHDIECIFEGPRNPNKYEALQHVTSFYRWMAVCEGRPSVMNWLVMKAKR